MYLPELKKKQTTIFPTNIMNVYGSLYIERREEEEERRNKGRSQY